MYFKCTVQDKALQDFWTVGILSFGVRRSFTLHEASFRSPQTKHSESEVQNCWFSIGKQ